MKKHAAVGGGARTGCNKNISGRGGGGLPTSIVQKWPSPKSVLRGKKSGEKGKLARKNVAKGRVYL